LNKEDYEYREGNQEDGGSIIRSDDGDSSSLARSGLKLTPPTKKMKLKDMQS